MPKTAARLAALSLCFPLVASATPSAPAVLAAPDTATTAPPTARRAHEPRGPIAKLLVRHSAALAAAAAVTPAPLTVATPSRTIEVVFALDTTGSMGGLIDGAKRTIWGIIKHIRDSEPNAKIRIGFVAYRDIGDDYVTKLYPLTEDLDAAYVELTTYQAGGGGDAPEHVNRAVYEALTKMQWTPNAARLMFLVGDAPPAQHQDFPDFEQLGKSATAAGIPIHTIRCGGDGTTAKAWTRLASLTGGEFATIEQDGGVKQIASPYDAKMAELNDKLDRTTLVVGGASTHRAYATKIAASSGSAISTKADRAASKAKAAAPEAAALDAADAVTAYQRGNLDVGKLKEEELPAELKGKDAKAKRAVLEARSKERQAIIEELAKLSTRRDQYLADEAKKAPSSASSFDAKVRTSIDKSLKKPSP